MYKLLHIPTGECRFIIDSYASKPFYLLIRECCERGRCPETHQALKTCDGCCWFDSNYNEAEYLLEKIDD